MADPTSKLMYTFMYSVHSSQSTRRTWVNAPWWPGCLDTRRSRTLVNAWRWRGILYSQRSVSSWCHSLRSRFFLLILHLFFTALWGRLTLFRNQPFGWTGKELQLVKSYHFYVGRGFKSGIRIVILKRYLCISEILFSFLSKVYSKNTFYVCLKLLKGNDPHKFCRWFFFWYSEKHCVQRL